MTIAYLDSSAIVKRYVLEKGSDTISKVYDKSLNGELILATSAWNIGEVLGVLDKYFRRGWLGEDDYNMARIRFLAETLRLLRLRILEIVPVKTRIIIRSWRLIEEHHIYEADAIQVVSAKTARATEFYTGDKRLQEIAAAEGLKTIYLG